MLPRNRCSATSDRGGVEGIGLATGGVATMVIAGLADDFTDDGRTDTAVLGGAYLVMGTIQSISSWAGESRYLRARIRRIVLTVPTPLPRFWLAALASLGETVDLGAEVPSYSAGDL